MKGGRAMKTAVNVSPEIIDWVIGSIQHENPEELKILIKWQSGRKTPTFNQIQEMSKAINIPLGYFFLEKPPKEDLSFLEYRTVDSIQVERPSRNLLDTIHDMENIRDWMRDYQIAIDAAPLAFVGAAKDIWDAQTIAAMIRDTLRIPLDWFRESENSWDSFKRIRTCAENCGIIIMLNGIVGNNTHRKLDIESFRAFMLLDEYAPLIFINTNDSKNGKLFSLFHEIAHIWLGIDDFYNDRYGSASKVSPKETLCNAVAAELLVPQSIFIDEWNNPQDSLDINSKIPSLATNFRCGTVVIARKALINRLITQNQYDVIVQNAIENYLKAQTSESNSGGGNFYRTMATRIDKRFLNALANSVYEGKTQYTDAFRLTNTNLKTFVSLVERVRGGVL